MENFHPSTALEEKVSCLLRSETYAGKPTFIESIETHMSWVFMTPTDVYKLKKPVQTSFLDFSTQEARHYYCGEEVRLNRKLAADVYIGTEPLTRNDQGILQVNGDGDPVDWLVHMCRLPQDRFLDTLIRKGRIDWQLLDQLLKKLCDFYAEAPMAGLSADRYIQQYARNIAYNRQCLLDSRYRLDQGQVKMAAAAQYDVLQRQPGLLGDRALKNRIIEAHGDLRPEHICLTAPPVIIDRLEFNRALRLLDPADELAYFHIECDKLNASPVGEYSLAQYQKITGDHPPLQLVAFYRAYRAGVRARLAAAHLADDPRQQRGNWLSQAADYLNLSVQHARQLTHL